MHSQITHLLIIDDDTRIRKLLSKFLIDSGFIVTSAASAAQARELLKEFIFDLLIVDVMMPGESGVEFTAWLRGISNVPVIILTAMGEAADRINGLESGADDYLPKPFDPRELLLRVRNIILRVRPELKSKFIFGAFIFDTANYSLKKSGAVVTISSNEAKLLQILCNEMGRVVTREEMAKLCGGVNERTIDVQITRLRSKIEDNPKNPIHLKTIRGKGYILYV
jgi:two-component system phosphate regulon response regulator OmpR